MPSEHRLVKRAVELLEVALARVILTLMYFKRVIEAYTRHLGDLVQVKGP